MRFAFSLILALSLPKFAHLQPGTLMPPIGHTGNVNAAVVTPDGRKFISAGTDKTLKIWDNQTGALLKDIHLSTTEIISLYCSANGKDVFALTKENKIKVYDPVSGNLLTGFEHLPDSLEKIELANEDRTLLIYREDGSVILMEASTGNIWGRSSCYQSIVSNDKKWLITFTLKYIERWSLQSHSTNIFFFDHDNTQWVLPPYLSNNNCYLGFSLTDGSSYLYDLEHANLLRKFNGRVFGFSDLKQLFAITDHDSSNDQLVFIDPGKNKIDKTIFHYPFKVKNLTFSRDGSEALIITSKGWLLFNLKRGEIRTLNPKFNIQDVKHCFGGKSFLVDRVEGPNGLEMVSVIDGETGAVTLKSPEGDWVDCGTDSLIYFQELWRTNENAITGYNINNGQPSIVFKGRSMMVSNIIVQPGTNNLLLFPFNTPLLFEIMEGKIIGKLTSGVSGQFSPDGKHIITTPYNDSIIRIWSADSLKPERIVGWRGRQIINAAFSPDGKKVALVAEGWFKSNLRVIDLVKGVKLFEENADSVNGVVKVSFIPGTTQLLAIPASPQHGEGMYEASYPKILDADNGKLLYELKDKIFESDKGNNIICDISVEGKIVLSDGNEIIIWDALKNQWVTRIHTDGGTRTVRFNDRGDRLICGEESGKIKIYSIEKGALVLTLSGHSGVVMDAVIMAGGKIVASAGDDNKVKFWNIAEKRQIAETIITDSAGYITVASNGFYRGTQNAIKDLYYVDSTLNVVAMEQLDLKYNRPDKLLEALGNEDTLLQRIYFKAWVKRMERLGLDTSQFNKPLSIPIVSLINRDSIPYENYTGIVKLRIRANDKKDKLDRLNIWINEVPLYGSKGFSLGSRNSMDTTIEVELTPGKNRMEIGAINQNGQQNYRSPLIVNSNFKTSHASKLIFVGIGIDSFQNKRNSLAYSVKDIRDLSRALKAAEGSSIVIDTFFNQQVNLSSIKQIRRILESSNKEDRVIIAYSGHGLLDRSYNYYLSSWGVEFNDPVKEGIPYEQMEALLDSIPARKKLLLIDACHSGVVDKTEGIGSTKKIIATGLVVRGGITTSTGSPVLHNSFELMQDLFINLENGTGSTVIAAASGSQNAIETDQLKHGVFTYCLLEALRKFKPLSVNKLRSYVFSRVQELTNGLQRPTSRQESIRFDWLVIPQNSK